MEIPFAPIPENFRIIDAVCSIKAMDENGLILVFHRFTEGMNDWEAIGRCIVMSDCLRSDLALAMAPDEEDDDDA